MSRGGRAPREAPGRRPRRRRRGPVRPVGGPGPARASPGTSVRQPRASMSRRRDSAWQATPLAVPCHGSAGRRFPGQRRVPRRGSVPRQPRTPARHLGPTGNQNAPTPLPGHAGRRGGPECSAVTASLPRVMVARRPAGAGWVAPARAAAGRVRRRRPATRGPPGGCPRACRPARALRRRGSDLDRRRARSARPLGNPMGRRHRAVPNPVHGRAPASRPGAGTARVRAGVPRPAAPPRTDLAVWPPVAARPSRWELTRRIALMDLGPPGRMPAAFSVPAWAPASWPGRRTPRPAWTPRAPEATASPTRTWRPARTAPPVRAGSRERAGSQGRTGSQGHAATRVGARGQPRAAARVGRAIRALAAPAGWLSERGWPGRWALVWRRVAGREASARTAAARLIGAARTGVVAARPRVPSGPRLGAGGRRRECRAERGWGLGARDRGCPHRESPRTHARPTRSPARPSDHSLI